MGPHCALPRERCSLDPRIAPNPISYVEMTHTKPAPSRGKVLKLFPIWHQLRPALNGPDVLRSSLTAARHCSTALGELGMASQC